MAFVTIGDLKRLSTLLAGQAKNAVSITGGAIDATPIGGTTPAAGAFTTLSVNGVTITGLGAGGRSTAQLDKTSDTTLAAITGMTASLVAGGVYAVEVYLPTTANASGGVKVALGTSDTLTLTSSNIGAMLFTAAGVATASTTSGLNTGLGSTAAVTSVVMKATLVVNAAGTLTVTFAQNASFGTASSALVNGYIRATRIA